MRIDATIINVTDHESQIRVCSCDSRAASWALIIFFVFVRLARRS